MEFVNVSSTISGRPAGLWPAARAMVKEELVAKNLGWDWERRGGPHEGQADLVAHDVERHGAHGDATGDLSQSRLRIRLPAAVGQGLSHRLAGGGRDRLHDHANLPPPDGPHR